MKATLGGLLVFAAHAAALPLLVARCHRDELEVRLRGGPVAARFDLQGDVPPSLAGDVEVAIDGAAPGLERIRWSIDYAGGFRREVGAAQLVGPFQDPARPPCGARLVVGQQFLDDGKGTPGTVAALVRAGLELQLAGFSQFPAGDFERVRTVEARWARYDDHPADAAILGGPAWLLAQRAGDGFVRVRVVVELTRVTADVVVALVPRITGETIELDLHARASLSVGVGVVDWAIAKLGIDRMVSREIEAQADAALISVFDPPPPFELPGGRALTVSYCPDARFEMASGAWAALPLALRFSGGEGPALPPARGPIAPPPPSPDGQVTFDLDLDTVNALLFELWRTGFLDEQLAAAGLDARFNEDATVHELLTLRVSPITLALPPVVTPGPRGLRMAADLRLALIDRGVPTPARVWAALDVELGAAPTAGLAELELACEPEPGLLRPCYADLVAVGRERAADTRAELSALLVRILDDVFTGQRLTTDGAPAELVLGAPRTTAHPAGRSATVRIEVPARLEEVQ